METLSEFNGVRSFFAEGVGDSYPANMNLVNQRHP